MANIGIALKEGLSIQEALDVFEGFKRNYEPKWDLRNCVRENVYPYVDHCEINNLLRFKMRTEQKKDDHQTSV